MASVALAEWASERQDLDPETELLAFMAVLGRQVETALRARRALLSELLQARRDPGTALSRAGLASRRCVRAFDQALSRLGRTRVPNAATECAYELRQWLEAHIEACDLLQRAAAAHDHGDLRRAIQRLAAGSLHAHGFNHARERLARRLTGLDGSAN